MCGKRERLFLVGITLPLVSFSFGEQTLSELERLVDTAGATVAGKEHLMLREIRPACFIGRGKARQLAAMTAELDVTGIVFDEELSPAQTRNLEEIFEVKVLDRSGLILDIFAQHAHTKEGKLQVELAQLEYLLPRLRGRGKMLSRLGAGIGTRGPGETKLETDRRRILKRIGQLKREILHLGKIRATQRRRRMKEGIPTVSLIGYTNAGKSTLLNALTEADVLVEDQLFCTLDPTARRLSLPADARAILIDTVGFIRKLPHTLVASFRATLEEIRYADLLLLVVDASSPMREEEIRASLEVLDILKITDKPILTVANKIDRVEDEGALKRFLEDAAPSVAVSARNGDGLENLLKRVEKALRETRISRTYTLPYHRFDLLARLQYLGNHVEVKYRDDTIRVCLMISSKEAKKLESDPDLGIVDP